MKTYLINGRVAPRFALLRRGSYLLQVAAVLFCCWSQLSGDQLDRQISPGSSACVDGGGLTAGLKKQATPLSSTVDVGFAPVIPSNTQVICLSVQNDDKILIGGTFTEVNSVSRKRLARLQKDGSLDLNFAPQLSSDAIVTSLMLASDGKILAASSGVHALARLNNDGRMDASFTSVFGANSSITAMAFQNDGKILVSGFEVREAASGAWLDGIVRLNADGSADKSYYVSSGSMEVSCIVVQPDDKALIAGRFRSLNDVAQFGIARLSANGMLDAAFDSGAGLNGYATSLSLQNDGKIVVGGIFNQYNGVKRNRIARLNSDGSVDNGFDPDQSPNPGPSGGLLTALRVQSDGCILIAGDSLLANTTASNQVARLTPFGGQDTSFNPVLKTQGIVRQIAMQSDGRVLLVGGFSAVDGIAQRGIARLNKGYVNLAPILRNPTRSTSGFDVEVETVAGKTYILEYKNAIEDAIWSPLPGVDGNDSTVQMQDRSPMSSQRLYRIRVD